MTEKYNVYVDVTVTVKVYGVEASSAQEAARKADEMLGDGKLHDMFSNRTPALDVQLDDGSIASAGYCEEVTGFVVDVVGDRDYENTEYFDGSFEKK